MHSVWMAWFQFWGKQHLHIDGLFFCNILNLQQRIEWVQLKMQWHLVIAKLPDGHLKFECSILHSNVDFYFKFAPNIRNSIFFLPALIRRRPTAPPTDQNSLMGVRTRGRRSLLQLHVLLRFTRSHTSNCACFHRLNSAIQMSESCRQNFASKMSRTADVI